MLLHVTRTRKNATISSLFDITGLHKARPSASHNSCVISKMNSLILSDFISCGEGRVRRCKKMKPF